MLHRCERQGAHIHPAFLRFVQQSLVHEHLQTCCLSISRIKKLLGRNSTVEAWLTGSFRLLGILAIFWISCRINSRQKHLSGIRGSLRRDRHYLRKMKTKSLRATSATHERESSTTTDSTTTDWHRPDDRFIPLRAEDLEQVLIADAAFFGCDSEELRKTCERFREQIDRESRSFRRLLEREYAPFDPDRDTMSLTEIEDCRRPEDYENILRRLSFLFDKANFEKLSDVQIEQAIRRANSRRMTVRVRSDAVEHLEVWVRGRGEITQRKTTWRHPIAGVEFETEIFRRMVVVARLKDDPNIVIKLFKDIPESDVESLLPHAHATMTLLDRIKLVGSGAGALGATVAKLMTIAISFAALGKLIWILAFGLFTLMLKTFSGYRNARINRRGQRVQHLYFQNLANNASALHWLISMVKQEELKEVYLAYSFGTKLSGATGRWKQTPSIAEMSRGIENYLNDKFDFEIDFDINDAINSLIRLGAIDGLHDLTPRRYFQMVGHQIARDAKLNRRFFDFRESLN